MCKENLTIMIAGTKNNNTLIVWTICFNLCYLFFTNNLVLATNDSMVLLRNFGDFSYPWELWQWRFWLWVLPIGASYKNEEGKDYHVINLITFIISFDYDIFVFKPPQFWGKIFTNDVGIIDPLNINIIRNI